ncbi:MAG: thiamine pyrophosphate-dependent enzyme [Verrucomicrobiota bacterium]|nr:thiamine pyrophosphate-dependent enzyme [Verrucomicrobiota bacterium]
MNTLTKQELIDFETDIANEFNQSKIRAPIHLYYGNEDEIIKVFKCVNPEDWIMCSWRSHYQCLLKGVPSELVKQEIIRGHSISLCFPEYRILSSAIVGGIVPIAVGVAMSIKRKNESNHVYCFMGEMTSETGIAHESIKYSQQHDLPITFIIEDNEKSVCTNTRDVWNMTELSYESREHPKVLYYKYQTKYPHAGAGVRVQF